MSEIQKPLTILVSFERFSQTGFPAEKVFLGGARTDQQ